MGRHGGGTGNRPGQHGTRQPEPVPPWQQYPSAPPQERRRRFGRGHLIAGAAAVVLAAGGAVAYVLTSGPSYPHPWCGPLVAQFHAKESHVAYLSGITALRNSGTPDGQLVADEGAYLKLLVAQNSPGTAGYGAVLAGPAVIAKVSADLQELNAECGQPADAYKDDNA